MSHLEFLRRIALFADLSPEGFELLGEQSRVRTLPADTWLFHQHDRGDA